MSYRDLFFKQQLFKREDGSSYLLSPSELELQRGKVEGLLEFYQAVADHLHGFQDTKDRMLRPGYLAGAVAKGSDFVRENRIEEVVKELEPFSLGPMTKRDFGTKTVDEMPQEIFKGLDELQAKKVFISRDILKYPNFEGDVMITPSEEGVKVTIRDGFFEELEAALTTEVSKEQLEDMEEFRTAVRILWGLMKKGYNFEPGFDYSNGVPMTSYLDKLVGISRIGKEEDITDEKLLQSLARYNAAYMAKINSNK